MPLLSQPGGGNGEGSTGGSSDTGFLGGAIGKSISGALNALDPAKLRLNISGLLPGGASTQVDKTSGTVQKNFPGSPPVDWRIKIGLPNNGLFYLDPTNKIQAILANTKGVIFPYTPSISVTHNARYQEQALTHSNYKNYFYEGSDVSSITITGDFSVQNTNEGLYLLAAIYFFRSATKMFFGGDNLAGNPPPIVYLDGYGDFYFPHVPCVITSFQHTMPQECDYLEFHYSENSSPGQNSGVSSNGNSKTARLPTLSQIQITVQPVYSRKNIHNNMSLDAFSKGKLLSNLGGFL